MRLALLLLLPGLASAQTLLSISGTPVRPNTQATLNLTLTGSAGANLAGLQWTLTLPAGLNPTVTAGAAANLAGKQVTCNQSGATLTCLAVGLNTNLFADGIVAMLQFTPANAGNLTFGLSGTLGATLIGDSVTVGAAAPFGYTVISPCDVNGDTLTDVADVTAAISQAIGSAACTSDLNGDGKCTVLDVLRVIGAALGQSCRTTPNVIGWFDAPRTMRPGESVLASLTMQQTTERATEVQIVLPEGFSGPSQVTVVTGARMAAVPISRNDLTGAISPEVLPLAYSFRYSHQPESPISYADLAIPCCARIDRCNLPAEQVSSQPCQSVP